LRFWLIIARTLGLSVAEAQQRIDSREFTLWRAAYEIEPWGEERADIRTAILLRTLVSAQGGKISLKDALTMFDLWNHDNTPPPPKEALVTKVRLFNAGIRGLHHRGRGGV